MANPDLVQVFVGSLVDPTVGAHAVVNASNPEVALGSGVSGAIREACGGTAFQTEVRERWKEDFDEPLQPGDCLVTSAGSATAFRWVLHVPSVNYRQRDPETGGNTGPARISACFESALIAASELARREQLEGAFVLATPILGSGHGGLQVPAALQAMLRALRGFVDSGQWNLKQVVIATLDQGDARLALG